MKDDEIRKAVRERYAEIATGGKPQESVGTIEESGCCTPRETASGALRQNTGAASCCAPDSVDVASMSVGYSADELGTIPQGANMGLGCGNPTALASLKEGEVVLDLGSGGGVDCFIAANKVGKGGMVIGIDMTPDMVSRARENAENGGYNNVEFRLGEIENLPVADSSVDAVISNCVINLSPDKGRVFREAYRALKPGGRVMVSDIVLLKELPDDIKSSVEAYTGCIAGASLKEEYLATITAAGFQEVEVVSEVSIGSGELSGLAASVNVRAVKQN
ncbi:arsenite methyltransferase [Chloroflexota bacterium]